MPGLRRGTYTIKYDRIRTPNENTLAYRPLTSTTTTSDMKGGNGTKYNLVINGSGGSFGTNYWNNTASSYLRTSVSFPGFSNGDSFYIGLRFYLTGTQTSGISTTNGRFIGLESRGYYIVVRNNPGNNTGLDFNEPMYGHEDTTPITQPVPLNKRVYIYYTGTVGQASGIGGMIIDGTEYTTSTITPLVTNSGTIAIGRNGAISSFYDDGYLVGRLSDIIIEKKQRTAQERNAYYVQTKSLYS